MNKFPSSLFWFGLWVLLSAGCGSSLETVLPGRGAEKEVGPMTRVYPAGEAPRVERHGLWRGVNGDQRVWELRYTRGLPTGPYREWNAAGELVATWPYTWEGRLTGWARWFENGEPAFKAQIDEAQQPPFDPVGRGDALQQWLREASQKVDAD